MQISARNVLKGKITKIVEGPVSTEVTIEVGPTAEIVSSITSTAARSLGLKEGMEAICGHQGDERDGRRRSVTPP